MTSLKEFKDSPIKTIEIEISIGDLAYYYDNKKDINFGVDRHGIINYESVAIVEQSNPHNFRDYICICSNDLLPVYFPFLEDRNDIENYDEMVSIELPYFAHVDYCKIYAEDSDKFHIITPLWYSSRDVNDDLEWWGQVASSFKCWGQYLAYCRNKIKKESERIERFDDDTNDKYLCDDDGEIHLKGGFDEDDELPKDEYAYPYEGYGNLAKRILGN